MASETSGKFQRVINGVCQYGSSGLVPQDPVAGEGPVDKGLEIAEGIR